MDQSGRFSDYFFAKMGPTLQNGDDDCTGETKERCHTPTDPAGVRKWISDNMMLLVTLSGVILGVVVGFSLRPLNLSKDYIMLISYPGELFMRVLKLMILPLIISSLIAGSASLNARMNGKIALRTLIYFASTSFFNACLGIFLVLLIHPGDPGLHSDSPSGSDNKNVNLLDSLLDLGRNVFPDNLFQAAFQQAHTAYVPQGNPLGLNESVLNTTDPIEESEQEMVRVIKYRPGTNTLGIVFFCLLFGTLLGTLGERGQVVIDFFSAVFEVIMRMVTGVMWCTPLGISSVIAGKILDVSNLALVMSQLAMFIVTVAIGVFLYQLVIMQLVYFVFLRKNPFKFYYGLINPMLTAFATASTAAALPITFRCMNEKLRIDPRVTRFVLPIGCNINMDGTALFISVASIFIAQMSGMKLGFGEIVTVCLSSTAASMSSASVPSAALVLLLVVLSAIDAPVQDVTLLFAIDWFVDRIRTTNNMLGDCYAAAVVEHLSRKELMALDAATLYQEQAPNGHIMNDTDPDLDRRSSVPDSVIVDIPAAVANGQAMRRN
ncbi:excitatory amino acid transporter isoform X1 [Phlebotomus papatasi]|uniref:excitatory amino acid transporter isoform X1 n=2 Tax=Phlebotomus papatasi TaxID=29031 RepID=UPI0024843EAA|nr:excitatory amino acid transporter isoform X1 [Phlebotomus papatasi]